MVNNINNDGMKNIQKTIVLFESCSKNRLPQNVTRNSNPVFHKNLY